MQKFIERWRGVFGRVAAIPLVFMGVGVYRAWLSTFFRYDAFPTVGVFDYFLFEGAIGVACLILAFTARRIVPLWSNRGMGRAAAVAMVGGSALVVADCFGMQSDVVKWVGLASAGAGLAALILMWAEFYGSLNPLRIALYHALAILCGEAVKWLLWGMDASYLAFFSLVLPLVSLGCVKASMRRLPLHDLPQKASRSSSYTFPWKPILLMSVCTFAGGFGTLPAQPLVAGNLVGAAFVCLLVIFGVLSASKWFNFDTIYQLAFPLFIIGFLLVSPLLAPNTQVMALCYDAGYTMLSMFIMIVLSSITYRFGISAVWINGIERGIRYLVELLGWGLLAVLSTQASEQTSSAIYTGLALVMVVIFTAILFTERGLSARWGITVSGDPLPESGDSPAHLALRVSELSQAHDLSPREEEVLQLLARRETMAQIEKDLFVARGTIKAHISHIYRKLDVHSRDELYRLLEARCARV